jgi:enoyl-CoA hydratase
MDELTIVERHGDVAVIVMNRPQARNAMNAALAAATCEAIAGCQSAKAIVLTGADPAFCAGLDLRALGVDKIADMPHFSASAAASRVPMIAAVNGPAVTGGLELALACDFIIASERATFADTHLRVGVYPGPVAIWLPRRIGMSWARQMSLTGDFVNANTALRIGLVNELVPHEDLLSRAMGLARSITDQDPVMVGTLRSDWNATEGLPDVEAALRHDAHARRAGYRHETGGDIAARRQAVLSRSATQNGRA